MMNEYDWQSPVVELPKQGQKILCFDKGDVWVAQRFGAHWLEIPFAHADCFRQRVPQLWKNIYFPPPYDGNIKINLVLDGLCDEFLTFDELEKKYPEAAEHIVQELLDPYKQEHKIKRLIRRIKYNYGD